jgi:hypothetical protein
MLQIQQREVVGQLAVQELGGVFAEGAYHAEMGNGSNTVQERLGHG